MKKSIILMASLGILIILPIIFAAESDFRYNYKTVGDFMKDIPSINNNLSSQNIEIPGAAGFLIKNGNVLVSITMNDNSTRSFYVILKEKKITGISAGQPDESDYIASTEESTAQGILDSENRADYLLSAYKNGDVKVEANGFGNSLKLFFARFF